MSQTVCQGAKVLQSLEVIWLVRGGSSLLSWHCLHGKHSPQVVAHTKGEHAVPYQHAPQLQVCTALLDVGALHNHSSITESSLRQHCPKHSASGLRDSSLSSWYTSSCSSYASCRDCCLSASTDQGRCTTGGHIQYVEISCADTDHRVKSRV